MDESAFGDKRVPSVNRTGLRFHRRRLRTRFRRLLYASAGVSHRFAVGKLQFNFENYRPGVMMLKLWIFMKLLCWQIWCIPASDNNSLCLLGHHRAYNQIDPMLQNHNNSVPGDARTSISQPPSKVWHQHRGSISTRSVSQNLLDKKDSDFLSMLKKDVKPSIKETPIQKCEAIDSERSSQEESDQQPNQTIPQIFNNQNLSKTLPKRIIKAKQVTILQKQYSIAPSESVTKRRKLNLQYKKPKDKSIEEGTKDVKNGELVLEQPKQLSVKQPSQGDMVANPNNSFISNEQASFKEPESDFANQFLQPSTLINQHLQQIHIKKQQFVQDLAQLEAEIEVHRARKQKIRLMRLQRNKQEEIQKLDKDQKLTLEVHTNIKHWKIEKKEVENRAIMIEKQMEKQKQRKRQQQQLDIHIMFMAREQRSRMVQKMLKHAIKLVHKQNLMKQKNQWLRKFNQVKVETPKFKNMEKKLKDQEKAQKKKIEMLLQQRKQSQLVDFKSIKNFEKEYVQKIKARSLSQQKVQLVHTAEFNLISQRDPIQQQRIIQKYKKIKAFQQKLEVIRPKVDLIKKEQRQITIDKLKNPLKYSVLKHRGLSDKEIFNNYKNYVVEQNAKADGNSYLTEMKEKHKSLTHIKRQKDISELNHVTTKKYLNYLPTLHLKPKKADEIQATLGKRISNQQKIHILIRKSEALQSQVIHRLRIMEIPKDNVNYNREVVAEKAVDDLFIQALKAKIACASLAV